jgi:alkylation response protein AidB-like acyl-CoA dehydrogenase
MKLREEVHDFFMDELPEDLETEVFQPGSQVVVVSEEVQSFWMRLQQKAAERGYYVAGWPKEYGGSGLGDIEQGIIGEELAFIGVRWPDFVGIGLVGPALMLFGTEQQKRDFLPPIARGETICFQAFTEPEAGSDEANQQTRAVEDGDDYIINGQKVFVSGSYKPDWLFTLTRTENTMPKHRGLSLFLVPANTPGITFRPLPTLGDGRQNEVFFDDVRVNKKYMVGQKNRGFYHAMQVFEFERAMTGAPAMAQRELADFVQFCKDTKRNGKALMEDPQVRETLAGLAVENEVRTLASWYTLWRFGERERLGEAEYDMSNYYYRKFGAVHNKAMLDILGLYGQLRQGSKWAALAGRLERSWQHVRSIHGGGTFEIMRIVLAHRALGLPRIPAKLMTEIGRAAKRDSRS